MESKVGVTKKWKKDTEPKAHDGQGKDERYGTNLPYSSLLREDKFLVEKWRADLPYGKPGGETAGA